MSFLYSLLALFLCLGLGIAARRSRFAPGPATVDLLVAWSLYALLSFMGLRLGQDRSLAAALSSIGPMALACAFFSSAGTVITLLALSPLFRGIHHRNIKSKEHANAIIAAPLSFIRHLREPLVLAGILVIAFVIGRIMPPFSFLVTGSATSWILYVLLFFIGMQMGVNRIAWKASLLNPASLAAPIGTLIGSLAGAALLAPLFKIDVGKALSLGAGFGWYSLSGVLISNLGDPALGSAAFLANLLRESVALIAIPWLSATGRPELAIGIGGATSMDITLPLIERCNGPKLVPLALAHGLTLSFLVPILVPLMYRLPW